MVIGELFPIVSLLWMVIGICFPMFFSLFSVLKTLFEVIGTLFDVTGVLFEMIGTLFPGTETSSEGILAKCAKNKPSAQAWSVYLFSSLRPRIPSQVLSMSIIRKETSYSGLDTADTATGAADAAAPTSSLEDLVAQLEVRIASLHAIREREKAGRIVEEDNTPAPHAETPATRAEISAPLENTPAPLENSPASSSEILFDWLTRLREVNRTFGAVMPELVNTVLTNDHRRRLLGSGMRRYGYIDQTSDVAEVYSQFWPDYVDDERKERLKELIRDIEALRSVLLFFESGARLVQDLLLLRGDEAFRLVGIYYATVREAARRRIPYAEPVFELLRRFWKRRAHPDAEPRASG